MNRHGLVWALKMNRVINDGRRQSRRARARHPALPAALVFAAALTACAPQSKQMDRLPATPAAFRETDPAARRAAAAGVPANGAWWLVFADPSLDDLIRRADRNNFTVQLAAARLAEARAIQKATAAA